MRKKLIVLTTILGLIAFSGVAAAEEHESDESGDTTFNFGYDDENGIFIWGSSASDGELDCTLENGELNATYTDDGDGGLLVEDLIHVSGDNAGDTVEFDPTDAGGTSVPYAPDGDCALTGGEVAGPQGQINHGMFMKLFNAMFDGQARGCMVRHIAQSDLGKGDQQVNVPDVEEEENGEFVENSIEFETVLTECIHGPDEEVEAQGNGKGRPQWVTDMLADKHGDDGGEELESEDSGPHGPPDHARGKGRNG